MKNELKPCKLCGSTPIVEGGYSSLHESISYWCRCPKCHTIAGKDISTYEWGVYIPMPSEEEIQETYRKCEQSAIRKWNRLMGKKDK